MTKVAASKERVKFENVKNLLQTNHAVLSSADIFLKFTFSKKYFRNDFSVKEMLCRSLSGPKLFAKVISRQQKLPLAKKLLSLKM